MKYDKRLNNIWKCCTKGLSRYSLNTARFDAEKLVLVATDGHILTAIDVSGLADAEEQSFQIPVDALKFAQSLTKKDSPVVRIESRGESVVVSQAGKDLRLYYPTTNPQFPKWEMALPASMEGYKPCVTLSAELLLSLSESLMGGEENHGVCLWIKGDRDQVVVTHPRISGKYSVLMPMQCEAKEPKKLWIRKSKSGAA